MWPSCKLKQFFGHIAALFGDLAGFFVLLHPVGLLPHPFLNFPLFVRGTGAWTSGVGTHGWVARIASQRSATWPLDIPGTQPPLCNLVVNYCLKWPGIVENSTRKRKKRLYSFS